MTASASKKASYVVAWRRWVRVQKAEWLGVPVLDEPGLLG